MTHCLVPALAWDASLGRPPQRIDARVTALLRAIVRNGTLAAAARDCAVPYRTAWGLLEEAERLLGVELVSSARGRGASLTPLASRWIDVDRQAQALLAGDGLRVALRSMAARVPARPRRAVRIAASHDLALAELKERWQSMYRIELGFHGSAESLASFRAGHVDLAGFHVAIDGPGADPLLRLLDPRRDVLVRFLTREQGLMVAPARRRRVRSIADLARKGVSIVHRQPGSGTRLLADRLLAAAGIDPAKLAGHAHEEFTHAAVAATVASGRADAGFGVRAAAVEFGLAFIPLATERYLFACRRRAADTARTAAFRALLGDAETRAVVASLPGYALDVPGTLATAAALRE